MKAIFDEKHATINLIQILRCARREESAVLEYFQ